MLDLDVIDEYNQQSSEQESYVDHVAHNDGINHTNNNGHWAESHAESSNGEWRDTHYDLNENY